MSILYKLKFYIKQIFYTFLTLFFIWFLIFANYGFIDFIKYKHKIYYAKIELAKVQKEKKELLEQVRSLKENIDLDLLELQIRKVLSYARKNEEVYFWK